MNETDPGNPMTADVAVAIWRGSRASRARELSLVLEAAGIEHQRFMNVPNEWWLTVDRSQASRAVQEIAAYLDEREREPGQALAIRHLPNAWAGVLVYCAVVGIITLCAWNDAFGLDWLTAGEVDAGKILNGELWRTVTALMLHADLGHLGGNLLFGGVFGYFVARYFGAGLGWFSILLGGALGNLLNVLIQPATHLSIGASTAVFAALGLLTAHAWLRNAERISWRARLAPIAAGVGILAFIGTAGENTDILAHLMGFIAGFGLGALLTAIPLRILARLQKSFAIFAIVLVTIAWILGLMIYG